MGRFVLTLKLKTQNFQIDELNKRFNVARLIYNACLRELEKRERQLNNNKVYASNSRQIIAINQKLKRRTLEKHKRKELEKQKKELYKTNHQLKKDYHLTDASIQKFINPMRKHFKGKIDSDAMQKIASRAYESWEKRYFGKSKMVHYKKYGQMDSVECKKNSAGIRFKKDTVYWLGLKIPVILDENNIYEQEALQNRICYCRLKRKVVRGKTKYYVQLVLEGTPPKKRDKQTGMFKHQLEIGDVGIDIGTQTVAVVGDKKTKLTELAQKVEKIDNQLRVHQRKLERQRRANNPKKYHENGTFNKKDKDPWIESNNYKKTKTIVKELYRKSTEVKKLEHICLSNELLSYGNHFKVEQMNFKGLQKRAKETTVNKQGRYNRKKRFGKSLLNKAPKLFLTILKQKVENYGGVFEEVNTWKVKASQYNHMNENYKKKHLSKRWQFFDDGTKIQRDLYSAFLIQHVNGDLETIDNEKCKLYFNDFKKMHDEEIEKLILNNKKTPTSVGV